MKTYLISYDLRQPGRNYIALYSAIKSYGTWGKINDSTWIIKSYDTAMNITNNLRSHLDLNDSIFVIQTQREAAWYNVKANNDWLNKNL